MKLRRSLLWPSLLSLTALFTACETESRQGDDPTLGGSLLRGPETDEPQGSTEKATGDKTGDGKTDITSRPVTGKPVIENPTPVETPVEPSGPDTMILVRPTIPWFPGFNDFFFPIEVHEWGTFTSVQSPDGDDLEGLHHEEEPLPEFVHGRDGTCFGQNKCIELIPGGVTQKMETPVIYFHGASQKKLKVRVDFPKGVISQWFPEADSYAPAIGALQNGVVAGGSMTWTVELNPKGYAPPAVSPTGIWAPSRNVPSAPLRSNGEDENFIFYRGLGTFSPPIRSVSTKDGAVTVANGGKEDIPSAFLIRVDETGGGIVSLGGITAGKAVSAHENVAITDMDSFLGDARTQIAAALEASGLTVEESLAMVDTWTVSYFHTPGLRVLYVLPRTWTDEILPMWLDFIPKRTVRTLVGRIEVTTLTELSSVQTALEEAFEAGTYSWDIASLKAVHNLGRHSEAKVRAIRARVAAGPFADFLDQAIQSLTLETW